MHEQLMQRRPLPRETQRLVVTQSNDLAGSIQDMNLTEKRLVLLAAAVIRQADTELPTVQFDISDYRRLFNIVNNNLVSELLDIVSSITTRNIVLAHGKSSRASYSVVNTFAVVTGPDSETGRAYVVLELHRDMARFFLKLDGNFFSMPLLVYSAYRSNYALRVGEILAGSGRGDRRYTAEFTTDDLKRRLSCEHYANFAQFRRRVLEPAKRENDDIGYLTFDWDEHKSGRSIDRLTFHVTLHKDAWKAERQTSDIRRIALDNKLRQLGFDKIPTTYYEVLGHDRVQELADEVLAQVEERRKTAKPVHNPGAYLRTRIEGEIGLARKIPDVPEETHEAFSPPRPQRLQGSQQRFSLSDELVNQLNQARSDHALAVFESLESETREDLTAAMLKDVFSPIPTLVFLQQRPGQEATLSEPVRRMALIRLLERRGLVTYSGSLSNPRAFEDERKLLSALHPEDREAVIGIAVQTDQAGT